METSMYIFFSLLCFAYRRALSGKKNGAFYGKNMTYAQGHPKQNLFDKYIKPAIQNLHSVETPAWYMQAGQSWLLLMPLLRVEYNLFSAAGIATLLVLCASGIANYWFQGYINLGSGKPWVDPNENKKSEFVWPGVISFWWPRPWYGKRRIWISVISLLTLIGTLYFFTIKL